MPQVESGRRPSLEIKNYLCEERFTRGQKLNPLEYGKLKETQGDFRGLCTLAKRVFCATPTTAAIERVFGVAEFIVSSRRTFLGDETFEFLRLNHLNSDFQSFEQ